MGHLSASGPNGARARLARLILLHISNSNPMLINNLPERTEVEAATFEIAFDGMRVPIYATAFSGMIG